MKQPQTPRPPNNPDAPEQRKRRTVRGKPAANAGQRGQHRVGFEPPTSELAPLLINSIDPRTDILVPVQTYFGPFEYLGYLWMRRHYGKERTMREFLASNDVVRSRSEATAPRPEPEPAVVASASVN